MLKMEISKQDVWTFNLNFLLGFKVSTGIRYHHTSWNLIKKFKISTTELENIQNLPHIHWRNRVWLVDYTQGTLKQHWIWDEFKDK